MRKKKVLTRIVGIIILASLSMGAIVRAAPISEVLEEWIKSLTLVYGDKQEEVKSITYQDQTYVPIEDAATLLDKTLSKKEDKLEISDQTKVPFKLREDFVLHGFYAIASYDQFSEFYRGKTLNNFDAISFGWSRIDKTKEGVELVFNGRDFWVPNGYDKTLEKVNDSQVSKSLMVFADDNSNRNDYFKDIFKHTDKIVSDIVKAVHGKHASYAKLSFDGVTIDFENVNREDQVAYVLFLKKLREALGEEKTIQVAVPSVKYFGYHHYKDILDIVDYMILMEHDFDTKARTSLYAQLTKSPPSPIQVIKQDIETLIDKVGESYRDKIILQISFGVTQWVGQREGTYTRITSSPTYGRVYDRMYHELMKTEEQKKDIQDVIHYNKAYENPYLTYVNDKNQDNYIWYENWDSVLAKIKLAHDYDLAGISLWRIGTIPNYYGPFGQEAGFDIWYQMSNLIP